MPVLVTFAALMVATAVEAPVITPGPLQLKLDTLRGDIADNVKLPPSQNGELLVTLATEGAGVTVTTTVEKQPPDTV